MTVPHFLGDGKISTKEQEIPKPEDNQLLIQAKSKSEGQSEDTIAIDMKKQIPLGRFGSPKETSKAIAFLASPAAGYINGVSLAVDGGRLSTI